MTTYDLEVLYLPIEYNEINCKGLLNANYHLQGIPESLWGNNKFSEIFGKYTTAGWELVTVQPLLRAFVSPASSYATSTIQGYYFFWKRPRNTAVENNTGNCQ